jgi:predicted RNase H-like nuclease (RuvC/YqgF family)
MPRFPSTQYALLKSQFLEERGNGVALAAIQGLNRKLNEKDAEIQALKARLEKLEQVLKTGNGSGK